MVIDTPPALTAAFNVTTPGAGNSDIAQADVDPLWGS
jgi:hypothetical protein